MTIEVRNVSKSFGTYRSAEQCQPDGRGRRADGAAGPVGLRQDDVAQHHRRPGSDRFRRGADPWPGPVQAGGARPARRLRVPALLAVQEHVGVRERRLRPACPPAPQRPSDAEIKRRVNELLGLVQLDRCAALSAAAVRRPAAACGAGPRAGHRAQGAACWTSRSARSTPASARSCGAGCASCTRKSTSPACS
jgi:hypothetical protein